ncbi:MAG: hypothetical protein HC888_10705, partial [Candidatus Competibacteraceae bacterium]|nr:hypothetical protein [Candidatus Competibacteraceae bacterium]
SLYWACLYHEAFASLSRGDRTTARTALAGLLTPPEANGAPSRDWRAKGLELQTKHRLG